MRVFALMSKKLKNYKKTKFIQNIFAKENTKLKTKFSSNILWHKL
jgi:hypothetical protein